MDLYNAAFALEPGDRIAFVVRNPNNRDTHEFTPTITVAATSHVVLPIVVGTIGGGAATLEYPPRPFAN